MYLSNYLLVNIIWLASELHHRNEEEKIYAWCRQGCCKKKKHIEATLDDDLEKTVYISMLLQLLCFNVAIFHLVRYVASCGQVARLLR